MAALRAGLAVLAGWMLAVPFFLAIVAARCLSRAPPPSDAARWLARTWSQATLGIAGIRVELEPCAALSSRAPRIIIVNHQSLLDVLIVALMLPPGALAIAKREFAYIPLLSAVWWALDFSLIDRRSRARAVATMRAVSTKLSSGHRSLIIAPEGTRSSDGAILPFKKGAFHAALTSRAPILPVLIAGAGRLLPKGGWLPKPGLVKVRCLRSVDTTTWTEESLPSAIDAIRAEMASELARMDRASGTGNAEPATSR